MQWDDSETEKIIWFVLYLLIQSELESEMWSFEKQAHHYVFYNK